MLPPQRRADKSAPFKFLKPHETLLFYDDPLLYTFQVGGSLAICSKLDEIEKHQFFLVAPTNERIVQALTKGVISVRSAFLQSWCWIIEADAEYAVHFSWAYDPSEIPEEFLPESNVGLLPSHGNVADNYQKISSERPYIAMHYSGGQLGETINLGTLKSLIDDSYIALRKLFAGAFAHEINIGAISEMSASRAFSIPVREPQFASFSLEIDRPQIQAQRVKDSWLHNIGEINENIDRQNEQFFHEIDAVADWIRLGRTGLEDDSFYLLDLLEPIVPDSRSAYETIEISGQASNRSYSFGRADGILIKSAYRDKKSSRRTARGAVVELNSRSQTFLLRVPSMRIVTCTLNVDLWRRAETRLAVAYQNKETVRIRGIIKSRVRRDFAEVDSVEFDDGTIYQDL